MRVKGQKEKEEDAKLRRDRIARTKEFIEYANAIENKSENELKELMYKLEVIHDKVKEKIKSIQKNSKV